MRATTTTNQLLDTKSTLWQEVTNAQAQSASGGFAVTLTGSSISSSPTSIVSSIIPVTSTGIGTSAIPVQASSIPSTGTIAIPKPPIPSSPIFPVI